MKITLRPSVTIDGFIADLNGECYSWISPEDEERYNQSVIKSGCEILGRKTYEQYKKDIDSRKNVITYIYTNQKKFKNTENVRFVGGNIKEAVKAIESDGFNELIVSGGGELNGLLASEKLIDEAHLSVHSIFLYQGIPLFGSYNPKLKLELISSNADVPGVVQSFYKVKYY